MVKVTVMLVTKRKEPKFEYALQSLKEQTFPHDDFEYIIIDGYYHNRKDDVLSLIHKFEVDFPVLYLPDKPCRWRGQRPCISNARNTALIFAKGQYIVQTDDCTKMPNDWIEKHLLYLEKDLEKEKRYIVAGSWIGYQFTTEDEHGIEGCYGPEYRSTIIKEPKEVGAGWFYGHNCSYPLEPILDINGFDEILDGEMGQEDIDLAIRLERQGYKVMYDPTNITYSFLVTHTYEKNIIPVNKMLKDGILHYSNEFSIQELLEDTERTWPKGNMISIKGSRKIWKSGLYSIEQMYEMMEKWIDPNPIDWRDGKLIVDKLCEEKGDYKECGTQLKINNTQIVD